MSEASPAETMLRLDRSVVVVCDVDRCTDTAGAMAVVWCAHHKDRHVLAICPTHQLTVLKALLTTSLVEVHQL